MYEYLILRQSICHNSVRRITSDGGKGKRIFVGESRENRLCIVKSVCSALLTLCKTLYVVSYL